MTSRLYLLDHSQVDLGEATASDARDGVIVPSVDNSGPFPPGPNSVVWSASDRSGILLSHPERQCYSSYQPRREYRGQRRWLELHSHQSKWGSGAISCKCPFGGHG